ncbi:M56 family metallopeptidase [Paenibacillus dokdonensis]|uniref:M56 family metallopeptidase n=1 Tax=Paenibacillus dokdonensis TaxID=2567944 RepID=A0ABU6GPE8_9BACL|nr:M56 family metallopeptidase [Paenibacillus dokdonensis]MEC0240022.1 M56 family metallopeptidase [Paenibacillus dokdonensis]
MNYLETVFSLLFTASVASTVILLLLLLIRKLFQKHLKPRVVQILWFLVLVKLLVPIAPQSPISLFNVLPQTFPMEWNSDQKSKQPTHLSEDGSNTEIQSNDADVQKQLPELTPNRADEPGPSSVTRSSQDHSPGTTNELTWLSISALVWLVGLLCLGGYYLFSTLIFRKRVGNALKIEDTKVLNVLEACKRKLNIKRRIYAYETSHLRSPCLYGLWKPKIYLPEDIGTIADSNQLKHILMHELIHYKRKDLWFNSLWALSVGMHWYNPLVWLSVRKMKADQEVACDASVLEALGEREALSYGMTLLMLSRSFSQQPSPRINLSHFGNNKYEAKRRMMMIAKFRKGSYKLSVAATLLIIVLSAILLTNASDAGRGAKLDIAAPSVNSGLNLYPTYNDRFRWFHSLDRALDFPKYNYKVPDYLPEGYQLEDILYSKNVTNINDTDPIIDVVSVTFVSNFGKKNEQTIEVKASKGKGNLLEEGELRGAPYSQIPPNPNKPLEYRQEAVTIGNVKGTLFTDMRRDKKRPETGKSFYWQDDNVWYAIDYYSEYMSQEDLTKMVQSFVMPKEVQHVRYDGAGNSFPLYDEKDLLAAKNILGFKVKIPLELPGLKLSGSVLLRAGDQNTMYGFRQATDALWTTYRAPYDSSTYDTSDYFSLYQSNEPLFDASLLSLTRTLEMDGVEISAYEDKNHVYLSSDKEIKLPYYLWKQDDIYYTVVFWGMDKQPEDNLKAMISSPTQ